jgi:serine/threonine-protein kinase
VGPWRIVDRRGCGTYGAVYLAEGVAPEASGRVALKLAHHPWNARFGREAELLARLSHPCVPRLLDQGEWLSSANLPHLYLAMELVEGIPLYEWAHAVRPSSRQVLQVLAGLARALEATHAMGGVHRDVKGDNVLVRLSDGQPFLIDFGSGYYEGAPSLTWQVFPPQTPAYRSPEAYRFALDILKSPVKVYSPGPAEDIFALGVTGYRLVTGEYPPVPEPLDPRFHVWRTEGPGPQPAHELNPHCAPELSALISRMLSRQPKARGSARELAEALERAAKKPEPEADAPLFSGAARKPVAVAPRSSHFQPEDPSWRPRLALASAAGLLVLGALWVVDRWGWERAARHEEAEDAGTVAVGDSVPATPVPSTHALSAGTAIALEMPDKPFPRQLRPDARGQCPNKSLVAINGGCWFQVTGKKEDCQVYSYVYKGACYQPIYRAQSPATSGPTESLDGGSESSDP